MNVIEKFDRTMAKIEDLAEDPTLTAHDIGTEIARLNGLQIRDMSSVFSYLLNTTLNSYITGRKLTAAYRSLVTNPEKDINKAVEIAGYSDQPSFSKAFKRKFNMTPGDAFAKKDMSMIDAPMTWATLSGKITSDTDDLGEEVKMEETTVFGVSESEFEEMSKALELEAFYGFPRMFSQYAFEVHEETGYPLEDCFCYVQSLREYGGDFDGDGDFDDMDPEEELRKVGDDFINQEVYFKRGISVSIIECLRMEYAATLDELMKCDMKMLNMFPGFDSLYSMSFAYYLRAYEYYAERLDIEEDDEFFYEYISLVMLGRPIELAFDEIYPFAMMDQDIMDGTIDQYAYMDEDFDDAYNEMGKYSGIEEMAAEEERWRGTRIDDDRNEDDDYYSDEDWFDF